MGVVLREKERDERIAAAYGEARYVPADAGISRS